jgi:hypothetical protein
MRNQNHAPQFASWIGSRKESDRKLPGIRAVPVGVRSRTHREATMPKKSITALYAEFEKALAILDACRYQHDETDEAQHEAALDKCSDLFRRIVSAPADPDDPIPDMIRKIAAAGWGAGPRPGETLDDWSAGKMDDEEHIALVSIRGDLLAMQGQPPRRARRTERKTPRVARTAAP